MVAGHDMLLAALLVQPYPQPPVLGEHVLHPHGKRSPDAAERIDHQPDQGAVAQADRRRHVDAIQQLPGLVGREHRGLPLLDAVLGAAHGGRRVEWHHAPGRQPVEQHPHRRQSLLHGRGRVLPLHVLYPGCHHERVHLGDVPHAACVKPGAEIPDRAAIGPTRMRVPDPGGEELQEAIGSAFASVPHHQRRSSDEARG